MTAYAVAVGSRSFLDAQPSQSFARIYPCTRLPVALLLPRPRRRRRCLFALGSLWLLLYWDGDACGGPCLCALSMLDLSLAFPERGKPVDAIANYDVKILSLTVALCPLNHHTSHLGFTPPQSALPPFLIATLPRATGQERRPDRRPLRAAGGRGTGHIRSRGGVLGLEEAPTGGGQGCPQGEREIRQTTFWLIDPQSEAVVHEYLHTSRSAIQEGGRQGF